MSYAVGTVTVVVKVNIAGATISGHRAIYVANDLVLPCNPDYTANLCSGITMGAAQKGAPCPIQTGGVMTDPSWNWDCSLPVWLGPFGVLVQQPPTIGAICKVAVPVGPTSLRISPQFIALL